MHESERLWLKTKEPLNAVESQKFGILVVGGFRYEDEYGSHQTIQVWQMLLLAVFRNQLVFDPAEVSLGPCPVRVTGGPGPPGLFPHHLCRQKQWFQRALWHWHPNEGVDYGIICVIKHRNCWQFVPCTLKSL